MEAALCARNGARIHVTNQSRQDRTDRANLLLRNAMTHSRVSVNPKADSVRTRATAADALQRSIREFDDVPHWGWRGSRAMRGCDLPYDKSEEDDERVRAKRLGPSAPDPERRVDGGLHHGVEVVAG